MLEQHSSLFFAGYRHMWCVAASMIACIPPTVDAIAGVPDSGIVPAAMLANLSGIALCSLDAIPASVKTLLVIEDATEFMRFKRDKLGQGNNRKVYYGSIYACGKAGTELDLVGCIAPKPRIFTWNLFKVHWTTRTAYDLDGILCRDPLPQTELPNNWNQPDTAPAIQAYINFIKTVKPLVYPKGELGWIVTGRLERFRKYTEEWLKVNNIRYKQLCMADESLVHSTEGHAQRKGNWYRNNKTCILFVESDPKQARLIAEISKKPVVCLPREDIYNCNPGILVRK